MERSDPMKRAIRILVPILLAIALIACLIWYLFVYDPNLTRDFLLSQARRFERQGSLQAAQWCYDQAYAHANQDEDVAIELAQQYKKAGNYTKAEYTLSNAIADGGSVKLYVELCKTYVEQDKLLDAVNMLGSITDPEIKSQLETLRPAAPQVDPAPGFYTQYIDVTLTAGDDATLYYTTDGQYPSTGGSVYSEPLTLPAGETNIYALSVGENGLVSPLSIFGYTINGVIEPVTFQDKTVEAAVREVLGVDDVQVLYTNDLWDITELTVPKDAASLADLAGMTGLTKLTLTGATAENLQYLAGLTALEELNILDSQPSEDNLKLIGALPRLTKLTLENCSLSTIEPLTGSANLTELNLNSNNIRNISAISSMTRLETLKMSGNALTDLSALSNLTYLKELDVSYNSVTALSPLSGLTNLTSLNAENNKVSTLGSLGSLNKLTSLKLGYNALTDVSALSGCTALTELDISNNQLTDISALASLTKVMTLSFSYNSVTALPAFPSDSELVTIDGSYNQLEKLDALEGLKMLNKVLMDYNAEISSVNGLSSCPALYLVSVYGTKVVNADTLRSMSVIVNYDPTQQVDDSNG